MGPPRRCTISDVAPGAPRHRAAVAPAAFLGDGGGLPRSVGGRPGRGLAHRPFGRPIKGPRRSVLVPLKAGCPPPC